MKNIILIISIILIITGCDSGIIYNKSNTFKNNEWSRFDDQIFNINVKKDVPYDMRFILRHSDISINSIVVTISIETPGNEFRTREYIFNLKDDDKKWLGIKEGDYWYVELPVRKEFIFKESGNCKISIENKYPKSVFPGIKSVGFLVKKSN
jgi:gliding motility-associated lipoprotein GldH